MEVGDAINWAIDSIISNGITNISLDNLDGRTEIEIIEKSRQFLTESLTRYFEQEDFFEPDEIWRLLTPKRGLILSGREASIIPPYCFAKFMTLTILCAEKIEKIRVPVIENRVYSYRFYLESNGLLDEKVNFRKWINKTKKKSEEDRANYEVSCDINNFFASIEIDLIKKNLDKLEIRERYKDELLLILKTWSRNGKTGLPVGNFASIILSELVLAEVDSFLLENNINFVRYLDDFRFFSPDFITCQIWIKKLNEKLNSIGLNLNDSKTSIKQTTFSKTINSKKNITLTELRRDELKNKLIRDFKPKRGPKSIETLKEVAEAKLVSIYETKEINLKDLKTIVENSIITGDFKFILKSIQLLKEHVYLLDYFSDMLLKEKENISVENRDSAIKLLSAMLKIIEEQNFDWQISSILKVLSDEYYFCKESLLRITYQCSKSKLHYPSLIALEALEGHISKVEFLKICSRFECFSKWQMRRLFKLSDVLGNERESWIKRIENNFEEDLLLRIQIEGVQNSV